MWLFPRSYFTHPYIMEIRYFKKQTVHDKFIIHSAQGERIDGGKCCQRGLLILASIWEIIENARQSL